ncbi:MAG: ADP-glyceromanno-heptose 6-epimerase [Isosphaeraceae bacterium]
MSIFIVTGAAGFIGSNVVKALNDRGHHDVIAVDNLTVGDRFRNLRDLSIADYLDHRDFRERIRDDRDPWGDVAAVLHQGACADTTEADGRFMMDNNYEASKEILHWCLKRQIPLVYASSASVYGNGTTCIEDPSYEGPLNVYAYSKLQFDRYVRRLMPRLESTVVGLRYFNVYGPREQFKGRMASMVYQLWKQLRDHGACRLFEGTGGYGDGEQRRDFVYPGDVAAVNLHFAASPSPVRGIFNCGTGESRSFNDIARTLIGLLGGGRIDYIPFPESLAGKYQSFTQADISRLRQAGYASPMTRLEDGIRSMIEQSHE